MKFIKCMKQQQVMLLICKEIQKVEERYHFKHVQMILQEELLYGQKKLFKKEIIFSPTNRNLLVTFVFVLVIGISVVSYYYTNDLGFRENVRFAFEGFFNWQETGEWTTTSTERWQTMFIWPDNAKTWLIGDGYFDGPSDIDPYYVGPANPGYYKWTNIGYLRFIFYFGIVGLLTFIIYFCKVATTCVSRFKTYKGMFLLLLLFNFVYWCKVATDIFLVFALFLCISKEENEEYENSIQRIQ